MTDMDLDLPDRAEFDAVYMLDDAPRLGAGTFAEVLACRRMGDGAPFAVKIVDLAAAGPSDAIRARLRAAFVREALALSSFEHPHVLKVHAYGIWEPDRFYMVMDRLPRNGTLEKLIIAGKERFRRPGMGTVAKVGLQVGAALDYVHSRGVIHRDVKPANIGIDGHSRFRLLDFGLIKHMDGDSGSPFDSAELSVSGWGSFHYGAPEQFMGGEVGPWTDVYALGAVLYELLAGQPPVNGKTLNEIRHQMERRPAPLPPDSRRPAALDAAIMRCLEKDPRRREAAVAPLRQTLAALGQSGQRRTSSMSAEPTPPPQVKVLRRQPG